jgi:transposase
MENASAAFLDVVRRTMTRIRRVVGTAAVDPALLTRAERIQYDGYLRRRQTNAAVTRLARSGLGIKAIGRRLGCSRKTIRQVLRGGRSDVFRCRTSSLEPWLHQLDHEWRTGCHNAAEIWRRAQARGFPGSLPAVSEWATCRWRSEGVAALDRAPSARRLARLMTSGPSQLTRADAVLIAALETALPSLVKSRELVERFQRMLRNGKDEGLEGWIDETTTGPLASFAAGIRADRKAVAAAITEPWSNGQTEGQITRLKLVKRQMYGRAKLDLLAARPIALN